jgi:hypothetical protein
MRKVSPFVVSNSLLFWRADLRQTGDKALAVVPATAFQFTKPSGGGRVMLVDKVCARTNPIVAHGQEGGLHEIDNQNVG